MIERPFSGPLPAEEPATPFRKKLDRILTDRHVNARDWKVDLRSFIEEANAARALLTESEGKNDKDLQELVREAEGYFITPPEEL